MCKILKKKLHVSKKYCNFAAILHINCSELVKPKKSKRYDEQGEIP